MSGFTNASTSSPNDIPELLLKVNPSIVIRLGFGRATLAEVQLIIERMGRHVLDIGHGITLLHVAAQFNHCPLIQYLCEELHHPLEMKTRVGETPLDQAAWQGHIDACVLLLKYGADVDCQTGGLYTPLHRCAFYYHPRLAALLCFAGANRTIRDENNQTAYEVAIEKGNRDIANIIKPLEGEETNGGPYSTNNPKHPNFRPEAREAFFTLFAAERELERQNNGEEKD